MAGAVKYIKENNIGADKTCVVFCPDNIRNYITKFVSDDWMYEHGYMSEEQCFENSLPKLIPHNVWGQDKKISDMGLQEAEFLDDSITCSEAIKKLREKGFDQFPVKNSSGEFIGMLTSQYLMQRLANKKCTPKDPISMAVLSKTFRHMSSSMPVSELSRVLGRHQFAIVDNKVIASSQDLLEFMDKEMS